MKKLFSLLFVLTGLSTFAQKISITQTASAQGGETVEMITIDTTTSPYRMVLLTTNPEVPAHQLTIKQTQCWLEAGNGFYTTDPVINYKVKTSQEHRPFLLATNLYDTGKGGVEKTMPSRTNSEAKSGANTVKYTGMGLIPGNVNKLILRSNISSIVPGDTMVFAMTYKVAITDDAVGSTSNGKKRELANKKYKLYFFYNNNPTFIPLKGDEPIGPDLPFVRKHNGELAYQPEADSSDGTTTQFGFKNYLAYTVEIGPSNNHERTVFFTMVPKDTLDLGSSGTVYAVLKDEEGHILSSDIMEDIPFAKAHDPNYIRQSPACLEFPKKRTAFSYRIHFQNTGEGPAKSVKVHIHLPKGMDWSTLKLTTANLAGANYIITPFFTKATDPANDSMVVEFIGELKGRAGLADPVTSELTMGDLYFTIDATAEVENKMIAYADIYFMSTYADRDGEYEPAVRTSDAVSTYKKCCTCHDQPCCWSIFGLCWWWWVLIMVLIIIIVVIIALRKRRKNKNT